MTQPLHWSLTGDDRLSQTLERLDRTLGKVDQTMRRVAGDAQHMGRALGDSETQSGRASRGLSRIDAAADNASERMASLVSTLGRFGVTVAAALGAGAAAAAFFGIKTAAANETAMVSFELLLGSAKKATDFLAKLQAFSAATPFEMPDLKDAASRLLAVGVATERIIPLMRRLGDATSGMGTGAEGIHRAVYALQQMSQAGKVSLEDINQLTDAGIPALDALSDRLGITVAKLREEISKGKIKPQDMFKAIEDGAGKTFKRLDGMMAKQSATLSGMWSTFKDNASQALATAFEPLIPSLKKGLDFAATAVPATLDKLKSLGGDVSKIFKGSTVPRELMSSLQKLGQTLLPEVKKAWHEIVKSISDNREGLEKLGRFVAEVVVPVLGKILVGGIHNVSLALQGVIWVLGHVEPVLAFFTKMFIGTLGAILKAATISFGWIPGIGPKLEKASADFDKFARDVNKTLDKIDGSTVNVYVKTHISSTTDVGGPAGGRSNPNGRASGGPVWAGEWYDVGEHGRERFRSNSSGVISNADATRQAASSGDSSDVIGVVVVEHRYPDGKVTHEQLLAYKRRRKIPSLGLG